MPLRKWIQQSHLSADVVGRYAAQMAASPLRMVTIDDFLVSEKLLAFRDLVARDGRMEPHLRRYGDEEAVTRSDFETAAPEARFYSDLEYAGPSPGREMASSVLADLMFRRVLASEPALDFVGEIARVALAPHAEVELRAMSHGDVLNWHSDALGSRVVCMVVYLHESWEPRFGGRFLCKLRGEKEAEVVDPIPNRVILFDLRADTVHAVDALAGAPDGWTRMNYTIWFSGQA